MLTLYQSHKDIRLVRFIRRSPYNCQKHVDSGVVFKSLFDFFRNLTGGRQTGAHGCFDRDLKLARIIGGQECFRNQHDGGHRSNKDHKGTSQN
ncbi:hypothetical protein D3C72_1833280 [compost metagenome]